MPEPLTETRVETINRQVQVRSDASRWVRLTRYAALAIVVWSAALQLLAGVLIPPVAVIGLVFAGFVPFLTGERRKLALLVAVLAVVALLGNLPGTIDELTHPDSAPAFILTLWVTMAALVAISSGLAAYRRWSVDPIRAVVISAASVFFAGALASLAMSASVDSASPLAGDVRVVIQGVEFDREAIEVSAGASGFWVDNQDGIRHTFTVPGTDYEIAVPAMSAQRADLELAPGDYLVFCAVPGHESMQIELTVAG